MLIVVTVYDPYEETHTVDGLYECSDGTLPEIIAEWLERKHPGKAPRWEQVHLRRLTIGQRPYIQEDQL